jgi:hypothetical protein
MGEIHRAFYGERGGGHDLLAATDPGLPAVRGALGATDRPSAGPEEWSPYLSGLLLGGHYVLMRTFPAPSRPGGRGGFVFTDALFIEPGDVAAVSDLRLLVALLSTEIPAEGALSGPLRAPGPAGAPTFPPDRRARAAARELLAGRAPGRPVVWLGQEGFEDLLARIWAGLWPEARMALRFRASFDPADVERGDLTLVCTPHLSRARWAGFPVVDQAAGIDDPSLAETLLAGEPSRLAELLRQFRPRIPDLRTLRQAEAAAELLPALEELPPERLARLLRLLVALAPDGEEAADLKASVAERLAGGIGASDPSFVHSLRNLPEASLGRAATRLRGAVGEWVRAHFTHEAARVGTWLHDEAEAWWTQCAMEGVRGAVREWPSSAPQALWTLWQVEPGEVEPLCAVAATHGAIAGRDLADACPPTLAASVAEHVGSAARAHGWPVLFGLALAAAHGAGTSVQRLLDASLDGTEEALNALARRHGGAVLVDSALAHDDQRLTDTAARWIAREPALLSGLDPDDVSWRRLWIGAIQLGIDPWSGIAEPVRVRDRVLDGVLRAGDVSPQLLAALAGTRLADLAGYPRREELWSKLPDPGRTRFLEATAAAWVVRFRASPDGEPVPEAPVLALARREPRLLAVDHRDPAGSLRVGVSAFERIPGWREQDLLDWLRAAQPLLPQVSGADAERLGRMVAERRWRVAASEIFSRRGVAALRGAVPVVFPLLNILQQWVAAFEGLNREVGHQPDWYDALLEIASTLYPGGPEQNRVWERAGGDPSRIEGWSGRDRWRSAITLLRSGGAGKKASPGKLVREMVSDYMNNPDLKVLHDTAPPG